MNPELKPEGQTVLEFLSEAFMRTQTQSLKSVQPTFRKPSMQMRAVLLIFNANPT